MMKHNSALTQILLGGGGLLLLTGPFLWFKLDYHYSSGNLSSIALAPAFSKGAKFFYDLGPVLALTVFLWLGLKLLLLGQARLLRGRRMEEFLPQWLWAGWRGAALFYGGAAVMVFGLSTSALSTGIFVGLWMLQALGLNIAIGLTGLLVLGYAGFYALGGYTFAILHHFYPFVTWWMALPAAMVTGALAGWLVGLPCLRLRGDYLAIVTLGFGECFHELMRNWTALSGGDQGLSVLTPAKVQAWGPFNSTQANYLVVLLFVALATLFCHRLYQSYIGRAWVAIREDEVAAASMGIQVVRMKLLAFVLSAVFGAIAGVLYVAYSGFIDPEACTFENSVMVLAMVILGGLGSIPGVLLGSALLYLIPSFMRDNFPAISDYRLFLFGIIMVIMMLVRPQGLWGSRRHQLEVQGGPPS